MSTFLSGENQNQNCKFGRGHLVMSMRQGRGGDLCNRGDPPSNMTCHRYQPSPNIKWTRLPFSHKMCSLRHESFPKPPSRLCLCVSERSSWFWEADERQFVQTRVPREAERRRWWLPLVNGPGNLKWALSSWKQRSCHTTWEWCENQRRKKPTKVMMYFWNGGGSILVWDR